ncbi:hypothetical protein B0H63DRAFT_529592 [Podospora didyma]|uniref:RNase H type-1 domain-containing protein n=1 Tax=Podospora didyma TaxID=330526 RepID=A0AAE0K1L6_9PEZI|nr:hypothetical protein B0H63DRAFT_529592 [Podospora didyma]
MGPPNTKRVLRAPRAMSQPQPKEIQEKLQITCIDMKSKLQVGYYIGKAKDNNLVEGAAIYQAVAELEYQLGLLPKDATAAGCKLDHKPEAVIFTDSDTIQRVINNRENIGTRNFTDLGNTTRDKLNKLRTTADVSLEWVPGHMNFITLHNGADEIAVLAREEQTSLYVVDNEEVHDGPASAAESVAVSSSDVLPDTEALFPATDFDVSKELASLATAIDVFDASTLPKSIPSMISSGNGNISSTSSTSPGPWFALKQETKKRQLEALELPFEHQPKRFKTGDSSDVSDDASSEMAISSVTNRENFTQATEQAFISSSSFESENVPSRAVTRGGNTAHWRQVIFPFMDRLIPPLI